MNRFCAVISMLIVTVASLSVNAQTPDEKKAPVDGLWTVTSGTQTICVPARRVELFNGKDLQGWNPVVKQTTATAAAETWTVRDGVLHAEGKPVGYLRTDKVYDNYQLFAEWRWTGKPGNSGVLVDQDESDVVWPKSLQVQLKTKRVGDIILTGTGATCNEMNKEFTVKRDNAQQIPIADPLEEKPQGEWNKIHILVEHGNITVWDHGKPVNMVSGSNPARGYIGLQYEGAPIEFRNIAIEPLNQPGDVIN